MSGHSKWSKVKHQKETTDAKKGQAFTKAAGAIIVAVREGGGLTDPDKNFHLRLAIEKARGVNMPKENIQRAIERAAGEGGRTIESVMYEAYGPGGVAIIIEAVTDNRQRTVSEIKNILDHYGGTLATPGAVSYLFRKSGIIIVPKSDTINYDQLLDMVINAGADDVLERIDLYEIYTPMQEVHDAKEKLLKQGIHVQESAIVMRPITGITLASDRLESAARLVDEISNLTDVQNVYTNEE